MTQDHVRWILQVVSVTKQVKDVYSRMSTWSVCWKVGWLVAGNRLIWRVGQNHENCPLSVWLHPQSLKSSYISPDICRFFQFGHFPMFFIGNGLRKPAWRVCLSLTFLYSPVLDEGWPGQQNTWKKLKVGDGHFFEAPRNGPFENVQIRNDVACLWPPLWFFADFCVERGRCYERIFKLTSGDHKRGQKIISRRTNVRDVISHYSTKFQQNPSKDVELAVTEVGPPQILDLMEIPPPDASGGHLIPNV